ncbi:MAG: sulfurtransferase-like selenium metabolism protein YedF [Armatimonadetes bacterium]|nr:sulfurtransferase-like selenium metabolism protein YedF [Armatimonadota bacterium]
MAPDGRLLDCRGMLCPQPVLETKRAIEALPAGTLAVLVDNLAAKENVARAMVEAGHHVLAEEGENAWTLTVTKGSTSPVREPSAPVRGKTVVLVTDQGLGRSNPELGALLMKAFVNTIADLSQPPDAIVLMQAGVRLACEGSAVLDQLEALQAKGVEVLACGTCLDFFGLMGKLQAGRISNMAEIVETLMAAGRVIPL